MDEFDTQLRLFLDLYRHKGIHHIIIGEGIKDPNLFHAGCTDFSRPGYPHIGSKNEHKTAAAALYDLSCELRNHFDSVALSMHYPNLEDF